MLKMLKNYFSLKFILVLFFALVLSLSPLSNEKALAWETWGSIPMGVGLTEVIAQLKIVISGAAKQASVSSITQNVYGAASGGAGGGGPKFITDWTDALTSTPKKKAALYIEQLSKGSTQLKGSSFYEPADELNAEDMAFEGVGESGLAQYFRSPRFIDSANAEADSSSGSSNYASDLKNIAQSVTAENSCTVTYEGNPNNMFADGTFKKFGEFTSGNNDPWSYQTCMETQYEEKLAEIKREEEVKLIANQGFTGNEAYPGILMKEKIANVEDMGNQVIANANGIAEVITASVMKMGTNAMNNGIGNVREQIQKNVTNVYGKAATQAQNQVTNFGPGALYGN